MKIVGMLPAYLDDGRQGGQLAQWVELPGWERGPAEGAGQAEGG